MRNGSKLTVRELRFDPRNRIKSGRQKRETTLGVTHRSGSRGDKTEPTCTGSTSRLIVRVVGRSLVAVRPEGANHQ